MCLQSGRTMTSILYSSRMKRISVSRVSKLITSKTQQRKATLSPQTPKTKTPGVHYSNIVPPRDTSGAQSWPAPEHEVNAARDFLRECAAAQKPTIIVPQTDTIGLSSAVTVHRSLIKLGLDREHLHVHFPQKGASILDEIERQRMLERRPGFVIVLNQGTRSGVPIIDDMSARCMVIDHHLGSQFPTDATIVSSRNSQPVPPTSLLTYAICKELHPDLASECGHVCAIGSFTGRRKQDESPRLPNILDTFSTTTDAVFKRCISLLNAPRRTWIYDVETAFKALLDSQKPNDVTTNVRLQQARQEIKEEMKRVKEQGTKALYSADGKVAFIRIESQSQVHPIVAESWSMDASTPPSLEMVLVANYGYLPGKVEFSCRAVRGIEKKDIHVDVPAVLLAAASQGPADLLHRLGDNFARDVSRNIVLVAEFEEFCLLLNVTKVWRNPLA